MRSLATALLAGGTLLLSTLGGSPWPPSAIQKAQQLADAMDILSLLNETYGHGPTCNSETNWINGEGCIPPLGHYGIPAYHLLDGPQGVFRFSNITAFPTALTAASSWDRSLMARFGDAIGGEQAGKGTNVWLGPAINLARVPWSGRLWEYQGEDPLLPSTFAPLMIAAAQKYGISACIKHFALNVQEWQRRNVSSNIDRRTWQEIYLKGFQAAVDAGVGSVMCSYNRINGTYACENPDVLIRDLRQQLCFEGWVRSDGFALVDTVKPVMNGCDQEMPRQVYFGPALYPFVMNGTVPVARLRQMVARILTATFALNISVHGNAGLNVTSDAHVALARQLGAEGSVLLKNEGGALPIDLSAVKSIAVFGDETTVTAATDGSSGKVTPGYIVTPYQGIINALSPPPRPSNSCSYLPDTDFLQGDGQACIAVADQYECCNACTASGTCLAFTYHEGVTCPADNISNSGGGVDSHRSGGSGGRCYLHPTLEGRRSLPGAVAGVCPPYATTVNVTYGGSDPTTAPALASAADVAIVVASAPAQEGADRDGLALPPPYDNLISAVAAANKRTIVVLRCPGACLMPWLPSVPSVLWVGYGGQEAGNALADVITGRVNPSGKLILSFPSSMNDTWLSTVPGGPVDPERYPGTDRGRGFPETDFKEGMLMGYRWYDSQGITPLFPFGHGLSYTSFAYSGLSVQLSGDNATVSATFVVTNSGGVAGAEVAQVYVAFPAAAAQPPKLLKAFDKTAVLQPGQAQTLSFSLRVASTFSTFDITTDAFFVVPGAYTLLVGASSRDIRLQGSVTLPAAAP